MAGSGKRDESKFDARKRIAALGEQWAARQLGRQGLSLVACNWRSGRFGEIDLVMMDAHGMLVFVEVKTRRLSGSEDNLALALETIDWRKRRKLLIAARSYLARSRSPSGSCRLDAFLVGYRQLIKEKDGLCLKGVSFLHIESAFDAI